MKTTKTLYLAYGSNLSLHQMDYRCPDARIVGTAEIENYRLVYKGSGSGNYATIEPAEGYEVPVLVWEISERDEKNLDRYEGYKETGYCFYTKEYMEVEVESWDGQSTARLEAMVYIMDPERDYGLPSVYYENVLREGYRRFGFDNRILNEARQYTLQKMHRRHS